MHVDKFEPSRLWTASRFNRAAAQGTHRLLLAVCAVPLYLFFWVCFPVRYSPHCSTDKRLCTTTQLLIRNDFLSYLVCCAMGTQLH